MPKKSYSRKRVRKKRTSFRKNKRNQKTRKSRRRTMRKQMGGAKHQCMGVSGENCPKEAWNFTGFGNTGWWAGENIEWSGLGGWSGQRVPRKRMTGDDGRTKEGRLICPFCYNIYTTNQDDDGDTGDPNLVDEPVASEEGGTQRNPNLGIYGADTYFDSGQMDAQYDRMRSGEGLPIYLPGPNTKVPDRTNSTFIDENGHEWTTCDVSDFRAQGLVTTSEGKKMGLHSRSQA